MKDFRIPGPLRVLLPRFRRGFSGALAAVSTFAISTVVAMAAMERVCLANDYTPILAEGSSGIQGPHGDTLPALLLVLCLALALILLCRSSGRRAESKLEKLDEE